jgi:hypothetical protein
MSAFLVSQNHINKIVNFVTKYDKEIFVVALPSGLKKLSAQTLGDLLLQANLDSVNFRYREKEKASFTFKRDLEKLSPVALIKAVHCLNYQSCEVDGWIGSDAFLILCAIEKMATQKLQGYEDAEWGLI